jgi:glycosyltransferase involved in cell wall biosynthesis
MKKQLIKLGCPSIKLRCIRYGVDLKLFCPTTQKIEKNQILWVGRFVSKKNPIKIIEAFLSINSDYQLIMVGEGEQLIRCKELVEVAKANSKVIFKGKLSAKDVKNELSKSKIFLNFSSVSNINDHEGSPLSIMEAMACGVPVIATDHAGISEMIEQNKTGILVLKKS